MKKRNQNQSQPMLSKQEQMRANRNISEGERIYQMMATAMLSADKTIGGTVAMNYALSKLIANYHLAMQILEIDVRDYIEDMVKWWEPQLENDAELDQASFDALMISIRNNMVE